MATANLLGDIPKDMIDESVQTILSRPGIRIERIVSRGHCSPEGFWYDQDGDEWVLLVRGNAALAFEDDPQLVELEPGDHLLIPAHRRHRVARTSETEETIWLAVHLG
jgi:cupin 2 domain-containing protein